MDIRIIVDSCCDLTQHLKERLGAVTVPLTMRLGQKEYLDNDGLDLSEFMTEMKACTDSIGSASPAPVEYQNAFESCVASFAVTLSSKLSGSYANALIGKKMAEENGYENIHVFDSKSAAAAEVLIAVKIKELIDKGLNYLTIIKDIEAFIGNMKTYFVLENFDNLYKNGRLNKIAGKIISVLNIKLVMGADDTGNIALYAKPRGKAGMLDKMVSLIEASGKETRGESIVISHCNNLGLAEELSRMIKERFSFKEILVVPTRGISSMYANDKGIIMAF